MAVIVLLTKTCPSGSFIVGSVDASKIGQNSHWALTGKNRTDTRHFLDDYFLLQILAALLKVIAELNSCCTHSDSTTTLRNCSIEEHLDVTIMFIFS